MLVWLRDDSRAYFGRIALSRIRDQHEREAHHADSQALHRRRWTVARQFVITLEGEVEIGLGDGSVHRFGAGQAMLAEDLTGQGHTTRAVGDTPRLTATIPLDG